MLISMLWTLQACGTFQIHPFEIGVELPYSEKCHFKNVVTKVTRDEDASTCADTRKRAFILTTDAWRIISTDIENNCAAEQCTELRGKLDAIALAIDQGLNQIPW